MPIGQESRVGRLCESVALGINSGQIRPERAGSIRVENMNAQLINFSQVLCLTPTVITVITRWILCFNFS